MIYIYIYIYIHICSKIKYLQELTETLTSLYFSHVIAELYLESSRTSMMELFCEKCEQLLVFNYFRTKATSKMFDWALNTLVNSIITLKNLKIVLLYLRKYELSESLVVCT